MGHHVEILRSGRKDSEINDIELESIVGGQFGFRIEHDDAGNITQLRKRSAHEDIVLVYDPPAALWTKDPDRATLQLMLEIAGMLRKGARVRNDEYETYLTVDETYIHPHDAEHFQLKASPTPLRAVNWREQLGKAPKVILLLVLCYIAGKMLLAHFAPH